LCRIGCAHDGAVAHHSIFAFKGLHHNRAAGHECHQVIEKWAFLVDRIKAFSLFLGHMNSLRGNNAQTRFLQHFGDGTRKVAAGCIGLDDRKGAGNRHLLAPEDRNGIRTRALACAVQHGKRPFATPAVIAKNVGSHQ
jgi:hypothetical protein